MFNESYGEIDRSTYRLIRHYNVSPADFDQLVGIVGTDEQDIRAAIVQYSTDGYFSAYRLISDRLF